VKVSSTTTPQLCSIIRFASSGPSIRTSRVHALGIVHGVWTEAAGGDEDPTRLRTLTIEEYQAERIARMIGVPASTAVAVA
jgi:hypothetical protein